MSTTPSKGSPPQVRGKLRSIPERGAYLGITPAGAGKTACIVSPPYSTEDHPRRCGENHFFMLSPHKQPGSPPQVRGKLQRFLDNVKRLRITPAGAGKTYMSRTRGCTAKDHPRRCGENLERQKL